MDPSLSISKKIKVQQPAKKTMATIFWEMQDTLLMEFLPPKTTINSDIYCQTLEAIRQELRGIMHDNARPHSSDQKHNWEVIVHLPHSPDLAPFDFHLFGPLKADLLDKRFENDDKLLLITFTKGVYRSLCLALTLTAIMLKHQDRTSLVLKLGLPATQPTLLEVKEGLLQNTFKLATAKKIFK